jgi:hypothetical protein
LAKNTQTLASTKNFAPKVRVYTAAIGALTLLAAVGSLFWALRIGFEFTLSVEDPLANLEQRAPVPQTPADANTGVQNNGADQRWQQHLPNGVPLGLTENGSRRGLRVVPSLTTIDGAVLFERGQWILSQRVKSDPVADVELTGTIGLRTFQNTQSGRYLALNSGVFSVGP